LALKNRLFWVFGWLIFALLLQGCGIYSFTGASISPDTKTISVVNFVDRSTASPPFLAQTFSEKTREYYQRNTNLAVINKDGDLNVEGTITQYALSPVAPTGGGTGQERAAQTRLTIGVKIKFTNSKNKEQNFDQPFSFFQDFDQSKSLTSVERELIETISDQIILDIFNKTVANW